MAIEILDPSYGEDHPPFQAAARLPSLNGATVAVISNGKRGTAPFFDALEDELRNRFGVGDVVRITKPNYSAPAGDDIMDGAKRWNALVAGIGD